MQLAILLSLVVLAPATKTTAQEPPDVRPPVAVTLTAEQARILAGIRDNDPRAIREAGRSRNRLYLEALAAALPRRRKIPGDFVVQEALAQLGDTQQLQVIWCASIDERNYYADWITSRLARVGGWFAIRSFDYLMSPAGQKHWERALQYQEKNTDALQASPKFWISLALPELVPEPSPLSFPPTPNEDVLAAVARLDRRAPRGAEPTATDGRRC